MSMLSSALLTALLATGTWAGVIDSRQPVGPITPAVGAAADGTISSYIALGESYAAGVGAGVPDKTLWQSRCLRYNESYPRVLANDSALPGTASQARLINNACSGQTISEILATQFGTEETSDFHAFGKPQFATISAAGDDIDFKELVLSCIYEFPWKPAKCQDQINTSNGLLDDPKFVPSIQNLIKTTLTNGQMNFKDFRVYFMGYAQFFNVAPADPDYCSEKTWSLSLNPFTREELKLDIPLRTQLNGLATKLNSQIQAAVNSFADTDKDENGVALVKYVEIDDLIDGHRYCEKGKQEPVNDDDSIWFFQWGDKKFGENSNGLPSNNDVNAFYDKVAQSFSAPDLNTLQNMQFQQNLGLNLDQFEQHEINVLDTYPDDGLVDDTQDIVLNRVKTFHPKSQFHALIEQRVRDMVNKDFATIVPCGQACSKKV